MRNVALLIPAILLWAGCESDPMRNVGPLQDERPPPPPPKREVLPPFGISAPDVLEFTEGKRDEYSITVWVPPPGKAIVEVIGLPRGMSFDAGNGKFAWEPDFDAGNDPERPQSVFRLYRVDVKVSSDSDPISAPITRAILVVVRDTPRKFELGVPSRQHRIFEGQEYGHEIRLANDDFPKGPFFLEATGLPPGAWIVAQADFTSFMVRYKPGFEVVDPRDRCEEQPGRRNCHQKKFSIRFVARDLRGNKVISDEIVWFVNDVPRPRSLEEVPGASDPDGAAPGRLSCVFDSEEERSTP